MNDIPVFGSGATAALLDFGALVDALEAAGRELDEGRIHCPVRIGVPLRQEGTFQSMPASADDLAIHKLVSVNPSNLAKGLPTIFGLVTVCDGGTGEPRFVLDGPTLTGRRTAALSMLGVRRLHPGTPTSFLVVGTGVQARYHAAAIAALYPGARLYVKGIDASAERSFCESVEREGVMAIRAEGGVPADIDTVITMTTSKTPVYDEEARADRLVIGAGSATPDAAELSPRTIRGSALFVDNLAGARSEAGDFLQADVDWSQVTSIGSIDPASVLRGTPVLFKTVGCGAWDLAACRVARDSLSSKEAATH
ncbi:MULTISPECIES: bifunctional Delta(1)-pyrroline-2-carboxylate/Delta(1)-piperideine-2-carboxylate reductase [unclassified Burkholderia]|uniref:bifunctional Delta(1)-pyrroline-2-carboxylate/Delta(1)-piperideine-2- carboxylate reductase n=1 Tax=unclassified Burkholderia TaxID=2613784 RepID=UPI000F56C3EA|nr:MULTISPECIES: bifunctional Delta(1)-pyrroline-2-carboxylate/Delta(1)-piperideine-2-carboxylate reductase [unclassified Burkholderia]RQR24029.1 delta(1)-pyrroline-2-carboxylate reductase family protein [Burkholderia sp. Bp9142]RQR43326.1 delta(1)-pyrroline-2-carboxylate reductase family protein [Burkholderia sp. Bp9140]